VASGGPGWNPVNQVYRGWAAVGSGSNASGVHEIAAPAIPVTNDPGPVAKPYGYAGAAKDPSVDCGFRTSWHATDDIPYYPDQDLYGNRTNTGYKPVEVWGSGPYNGRLRQDLETTRLNAAINAVDDAAKRIRDKVLDSNVTVVTHVIGLGNLGDEQHELLKRIANTVDSTSYDDDAPAGMYIAAPSAMQLMSAFQKVGSEVLRLSK
jgi:hypothetical protein